MEEKFTPGPWKMVEILEGDYDPDSEKPDNRPVTHYIVSAHDENLLITYALPATDRSDEFLANARLIAACPVMIEAIEFTLKLLDNLTTEDFSKGGDKPARDKLEAAYTLATGIEGRP